MIEILSLISLAVSLATARFVYTLMKKVVDNDIEVVAFAQEQTVLMRQINDLQDRVYALESRVNDQP